MFQTPYKNILSSDRTDIFSSSVSTYITQPELHMFFFVFFLRRNSQQCDMIS
jgi:hypothetical protein